MKKESSNYGKRIAIVSTAIAMLIFIVLIVIFVVPKRVQPEELVDTYTEFCEKIQKNESIHLPAETSFNPERYDYIIRFKSRFSNEVTGYHLHLKAGGDASDEVESIQCRHIETQSGYEERADESVNGVSVKVEASADRTDFSFLQDSYLYFVTSGAPGDTAKQKALSVVAGLTGP